MNTKIVYCVISNLKDYYLEEAWASAFTMKYYNPSAHICLVCDQNTKAEIMNSYRRKSLEYIDEVIAVEVDENLTNMQRSRWIKTNLRNLIQGDFLFLDTDTIITSDISEIDDFNFDIGAVLDWHKHTRELKDIPFYSENFEKTIKNIFGIKLKEETDVFNSGVMYVKDNASTYNFYKRWNELWDCGRKKGMSRDQPSLAVTCEELNYPITEISGIYNAQMKMSPKYVASAKILHTFSGNYVSNISCVMGTGVTSIIKKNENLTEDAKAELLSAKDSYYSPLYMAGLNMWPLLCSPSWLLLQRIYNCKSLMRIVDVVSLLLMKIINIPHGINKALHH